VRFRNLGDGSDTEFLIYWELSSDFQSLALFWWVAFGFSFLCLFADVASATRWAGTMFGGLAPFLDTKRKATICTNAPVEICTSVKEPDLWSFYRTTADGHTKSLLVFANGQTIQLTEIVVTEFPPAEVAGK
jgi:hypothetical protein